MIIIGTNGFAIETLEVFVDNNESIKELFFFDNITQKINPFVSDNFSIYRSFEELQDLEFSFILGVGNPSIRKKLFTLLTMSYKGQPSNLISSKSTIGKINNKFGKGVNIMNNVIITSNCSIGNGVLINIAATIGHDCIIEDFVEICPGVNISGNCKIEKEVFIGTGAILLPNITIGHNSVIAAGAVVIGDVPPNTMYAGNPARFKKKLV